MYAAQHVLLPTSCWTFPPSVNPLSAPAVSLDAFLLLISSSSTHLPTLYHFCNCNIAPKRELCNT